VACAALALTRTASSQQQPQKLFAHKAAIVALTDDPILREEFERGLVAKAREHRYNAVTSYDLVPKVEDVQNRTFVKTLTAKGVKTVLMVRLAAIGSGSSLDAVKDEVSPAALADMRSFAKKVGASGGDDIVAIAHLAMYTIVFSKPDPLTSGVVWLDEPVKDRAEGIERLQDLIIANLDAARPEIREHFGMPPLPAKFLSSGAGEIVKTQ
jgi:hypothetical protein